MIDTDFDQLPDEREAGTPDFRVSDEGTLVLFTPISEEAKAFALEAFFDAPTLGGETYAVEHRFAADIVVDLIDRGYDVEAV